MAFYIDEAGKRGLKAEGKNFFAWDVSRRKFSFPVTDAPPKSRMERCSDFEARKFSFESAKEGWLEVFEKLKDEVPEFSDDQIARLDAKDAEGLEKLVAEAEAFQSKTLPLAQSLADATRNYGLEFSEIGRTASEFVKSITSNVRLPSLLLECLKRGEEAKIKLEES